MTAPPYMPLYIEDYSKDTLHLTTVEHGAYMLLLIHAWQHHGTIPKDAKSLRIITKLDHRAWFRHKNKLLAFFVDSGVLLRHTRVEAELAKILKKRNTALQNLSHVGRHIIKKENTTSSSRGERDSGSRTSKEKQERHNGFAQQTDGEQVELPLSVRQQKQRISVTDSLKYQLARPLRLNGKGRRP